MSYPFSVSTPEAVQLLVRLPFGEFVDALRAVLMERERRELVAAQLEADARRAMAPRRRKCGR